MLHFPHNRQARNTVQCQTTFRMAGEVVVQLKRTLGISQEPELRTLTPLVLNGQIRPDGTLHLDEKVNLPPGPVSVTVQTVATPTRKPTLQVLKEIWAEREAKGMVGRTADEVDAESDIMRDEDEERMRGIESI